MVVAPLRISSSASGRPWPAALDRAALPAAGAEHAGADQAGPQLVGIGRAGQRDRPVVEADDRGRGRSRRSGSPTAASPPGSAATRRWRSRRAFLRGPPPPAFMPATLAAARRTSSSDPRGWSTRPVVDRPIGKARLSMSARVMRPGGRAPNGRSASERCGESRHPGQVGRGRLGAARRSPPRSKGRQFDAEEHEGRNQAGRDPDRAAGRPGRARRSGRGRASRPGRRRQPGRASRHRRRPDGGDDPRRAARAAVGGRRRPFGRRPPDATPTSSSSPRPTRQVAALREVFGGIGDVAGDMPDRVDTAREAPRRARRRYASPSWPAMPTPNATLEGYHQVFLALNAVYGGAARQQIESDLAADLQSLATLSRGKDSTADADTRLAGVLAGWPSLPVASRSAELQAAQRRRRRRPAALRHVLRAGVPDVQGPPAQRPDLPRGPGSGRA